MIDTGKRQGREPHLDGIRGLAIAGVLLNHYCGSLSLDRAPIWLKVLNRVGEFGWLGVDLFFVLSGFLIGGILIRHRACRAENYFKTFFVRRFFRIVPLYSIAIMMAASSNYALHLRGAFYADAGTPVPWPWFATFTQNIAPFFGHGKTFFGQSWSLAVEEQFYLLAPLLIWVSSERWLPRILIALIAIAPLIRIAAIAFIPRDVVDIAVYSQLPSRMDSLLIGVLCAWALQTPKPRSLLTGNYPHLQIGSLVLLAMLVLFIGLNWNYLSMPMSIIGYSAAAGACAGILLMSTIQNSGILARMLSLSPLGHLGRRAYFLYIWHGVFPAEIFRWANRDPHIHSLSDLAIFSLSFIALLAAAELSWRYFEMPLIEIGHRFAYERMRRASA